jgi:hypothetical protein
MIRFGPKGGPDASKVAQARAPSSKTKLKKLVASISRAQAGEKASEARIAAAKNGETSPLPKPGGPRPTDIRRKRPTKATRKAAAKDTT